MNLQLTKREIIAISNLNGLLASSSEVFSSKNLVSLAIKTADELIKQLAETDQPTNLQENK